MNLSPNSTALVGNHPEKSRSVLPDLFVLIILVALIFSALAVSKQWEHPYQQTVEINLSPWWLPYYTMLSLMRGIIAYVFSLLFTILYARWAAYDAQAERVLIPILDVLQSIPFPAFLVPMEALLIGAFPHSNTGLELTCIFTIFTGQVWNMTFSFYYSLKNLPADFAFVGKLARFTPWQKFSQIELPFATNGLVYNSMVSMAGGWFFLTLTESFSLGENNNFRLPGIGSYMAVAQEKHDGWAQAYAVIAMVLMIVVLDQLIWRPLIIWSNKFKLEDTEAQFKDSSAILLWLNRSKVARSLHALLQKRLKRPLPSALDLENAPQYQKIRKTPIVQAWATSRRLLGLIPWRLIFLFILIPIVSFGLYHLIEVLTKVHLGQWLQIFGNLLLTLSRVLAAIFLSTLWTVPVGIWIGSNPKLARYLMPITQIAASFPSPMIFNNLLFLLLILSRNNSSTLEWGAIILMMLGTQWYLLFNIISGATAVPQDLQACSDLMHFTLWQKLRTLWLPGIFPALVTGWITAAGGAWNTSIAAEYITNYGDKTLQATGLGAMISQAMNDNDTPKLAAAVLVMAFFVVFFNRAVWKRLALIARDRFQLLT